MPAFAGVEAMVLDALTNLRRAPDDPGALNRFLTAAQTYVRGVARRFPDPDDVLQDAMERLILRWPDCSAGANEQVIGWVCRLTRNVGLDRRRQARLVLLDDPWSPLDQQAPPRHEPELALALRRAMSRAAAPWDLTPELRARARRDGVAARAEGRARDVRAMWALRHEGLAGDVVAKALDMPSRDAVYKAAQRGAAAVAIAAALLAEDAPDLWSKSALREVESRAA